MCRGVFQHGFRAKFTDAIADMDLTVAQRHVLSSRYIYETEAIAADFNRSMVLYVLLTNLVTICGILIASFATLQKTSLLSDYWKDVIVWSTWSLSLLLTLSNGFLTAFGIYKKYALTDVSLGKLQNEGWSFAAGVNRYKGLSTNDAFNTLMSQVEQALTNVKIKEISAESGVNAEEMMGVPAHVEDRHVRDLLS